MSFTIQIEPEVKSDIQRGIGWYNKQQPGLGEKFHSAIKEQFKYLEQNPFHQVRYDNVRCLSLATYHYMIHFTVDDKEQTVRVHGIFNTSRDPRLWKDRL
jgi:mRNA-degrading endonuclease RelE of RelBE toxin-antitoxin system